MEHSDFWTGWHGERWDFQNNEKTNAIFWIVTGWRR